jgi:hypothetical protein
MPEKKRASLSAADAQSVRDWMTLRPALMKPQIGPDAALDMFFDNALNFLVCGMDEETRPQARIIRPGVSPIRGRQRSIRRLPEPGQENAASRLYSEESRQAYLQENSKQARLKAMEALPAGTAILPFDQRGKVQGRPDASEAASGEARRSSSVRQEKQNPEPGGLFEDDAGRAKEQHVADRVPRSKKDDEDRASRRSMSFEKEDQSSTAHGSSQSPPRPPSSSVSIQCEILKTSPSASMSTQHDSLSKQSSDLTLQTSFPSDMSNRASVKTYVPVLRTGSNGVWR